MSNKGWPLFSGAKIYYIQCVILTIILPGQSREVIIPEAIEILTISEPDIAVPVDTEVAQVIVAVRLPGDVTGDIRGWFPMVISSDKICWCNY